MPVWNLSFHSKECRPSFHCWSWSCCRSVSRSIYTYKYKCSRAPKSPLPVSFQSMLRRWTFKIFLCSRGAAT